MAEGPCYWFDVEDLFEYARTSARPSGIQRVAFEIYLALQDMEDVRDRIGFVRHSVSGTGLVPVSWRELVALYDGLRAGVQGNAVLETAQERPTRPSRLRRLALRLPTPLRVSLGRFVQHQAVAVRDMATLLRVAGQSVRRLRPARDALDEEQAFAPRAGDALIALGAPWAHAGYGTFLRHARELYGLRIGLLVYDLIPLVGPEWCRPGLPRVFRRWLEAALPECEQIFAISQATRRDIERYVVRTSLTLKEPVHVLSMATGFSQTPVPSSAARAMAEGLGSYVLIVGTLEVRKNHALLFRVWRRLLEQHPGRAVPRLVFAGSPGWLVDDLLQQIRNSNFLDGHIVLVRAPSDAEIEALYRNALFTVCPSFYEGWGLPVTESLAHGRVCLISDRASLPEAGGGLVQSFDPDNATEALEKISRLIFDPAFLEREEARVRQGFTPVSWSVAARQILDVFEA